MMTLEWYYYSSCSLPLVTMIILHFSIITNQEPICTFSSIYQIGDSTSDTGNLIRVSGIGPTIAAALAPYGETFPGKPTGRYSDAEKLGILPLNPYLDRNASFQNGVNFAVAGVTVLDISFLATRGIFIQNIDDTTPLNAQIDWFRHHLSSLCSSPAECSHRLEKSLIILGDIGSNDIEYALSQNKTIQEIMNYVPFIPLAIANATRVLIGLGARRIVVAGIFPLGSLPANLVLLPNDDPKDDQGCSTALNNLCIYFNILLREALVSLTFEFPAAKILYADYYNAFDFILRTGPDLGFDRASLVKACCGNGGPYNCDKNRTCGSPGVPVCPNPAQYIHWDGAHLTQEAHRAITDYLIPDLLAQFQCSL